MHVCEMSVSVMSGLADCSGEEAGLRNRHQGYSRSVCKHLVTVIAMKNIITYTLTLAEVSSVSHHCEEQTQESILDRFLSKGPITTITAKPEKPGPL